MIVSENGQVVRPVTPVRGYAGMIAAQILTIGANDQVAVLQLPLSAVKVCRDALTAIIDEAEAAATVPTT
jgi:hypothetical protein